MRQGLLMVLPTDNINYPPDNNQNGVPDGNQSGGMIKCLNYVA